MGEAFPDKVNRLEHEPRLEAGRTPEQERLLTAHAERARNERDPSQTLQEARSELAAAETGATANQTAERLHAANTAPAPQATGFVDRNLKNITAKRGIKQVQRHETTSERAFSKLIHHPAVRVASEAASGTVSRPSGLLGGGLVALLGTSTYFYLAHHIGFQYNYTVFLLLFIGGFAFGLLIELIVHLALRRKQ